MALNIGKFTGYTTSGAQIFQKMDKGTRVITTMAKAVSYTHLTLPTTHTV